MLEGIVRESIGKRNAKQLKRDGYLIANIYANGVENINAAFKRGEFARTVRNKEALAFPVKVGDQELNVVIQLLCWNVERLLHTLLSFGLKYIKRSKKLH